MKNQVAQTKSFTVDSLRVEVYATQGEMAQGAAHAAQACLRDVLARQGSAAAIMASANSQIMFLEALVALGGVDWSRVTLFHMDEYLGIDANHTASFRRFMRERVEGLLRPKVFHYVEGEAMLPLDECERYTNLLQA